MNPADETTRAYAERSDLTTDMNSDRDSTASKDPEQIRREIDRTRSELGSNVDALADKVTPSKIMQRQGGKIKTAVGSVTDRVMGGASEQGSALTTSAAEKARGNPLAVGLIALGVGWLIASLIPASESEQRLAASVKESAAPLVNQAASVAKDLGESLREPAQDAAAAVKSTAQDAADDVAHEAADAKDTVSGTAHRAASGV